MTKTMIGRLQNIIKTMIGSRLENISAFTDARIAALKAGLRLTPDQEKNWPAFESAVRDMAKARAQRWAMRQHEQQHADPVERLQRRVEWLGDVGRDSPRASSRVSALAT